MADERFVLLERLKEGLNSPFGMVWIDGALFVANTDAVVRFPLPLGSTRNTAAGVPGASLPAGRINHPWTKNLLANADQRSLYVSIGSNSNAGERGLAAEAGRAAIMQIDIASGTQRPWATGLRNPVGMVLEPASGVL